MYGAIAHVKQFTPSLPDFSVLHPVRVIAAGFNLLTVQQPRAAERLARHAAKTLRISLGGFALTMTIDAQGHLSQADRDVVPDVVLEVIAEKLDFARLSDALSQTNLAQYIHISGQADLAQVVSDLARDLRPDPEDALANWIGDVPARKFVQGTLGVLGALRTMSQGLAQNVAEYFSEETATLLGRPSLLMHGRDLSVLGRRLDQLADSQTRLEQRMIRLAHKRLQA